MEYIPTTSNAPSLENSKEGTSNTIQNPVAVAAATLTKDPTENLAEE